NNNKGERFQSTDDGGPLVNPCDDDPTVHFRFVFENNIASVYGTSIRGATTEKLLALNRSELRKHRSDYIRKLFCIKIFALKGDRNALELSEEAKKDDAEYAAFARSLK
ncbi:MAG: HNH endonuclease, partial [bacterium]